MRHRIQSHNHQIIPRRVYEFVPPNAYGLSLMSEFCLYLTSSFIPLFYIHSVSFGFFASYSIPTYTLCNLNFLSDPTQSVGLWLCACLDFSPWVCCCRLFFGSGNCVLCVVGSFGMKYEYNKSKSKITKTSTKPELYLLLTNCQLF